MYDINDFDFQKDTIIETPLQLSKYLYNKVKRKIRVSVRFLRNVIKGSFFRVEEKKNRSQIGKGVYTVEVAQDDQNQIDQGKAFFVYHSGYLNHFYDWRPHSRHAVETERL